jgi:hypothetical protein
MIPIKGVGMSGTVGRGGGAVTKGGTERPAISRSDIPTVLPLDTDWKYQTCFQDQY